MGHGDQLIATGLARGAAKRGKRIAFGDGKKIIWDHHSALIFRNNPNIAPPGREAGPDIEWVPFYRGNRLYNKQVGNRWEWNYDFRPVPGEVFFDAQETEFAKRFGSGFVVIEPNVPDFKTVAPNKQWPKDRYANVARRLKGDGYRVCQFSYSGGVCLDGIEPIKTPSFRHALAVLKNAALYIGPEGGLHHGAAAVGIPAVVVFGGFIPAAVTGYDTHINLTGGAEACGSLTPCEHCRATMLAISSNQVYDAAKKLLTSEVA